MHRAAPLHSSENAGEDVAMNQSSWMKGPDGRVGRKSAGEMAHGADELRDRATRFVKEQPMLAVVGAGVLGAIVGGVLLRRTGRLLFMTAAGFVLTELWKREGHVDVRGLLDQWTSHERS
jgi:hypothetical protein